MLTMIGASRLPHYPHPALPTQARTLPGARSPQKRYSTIGSTICPPMTDTAATSLPQASCRWASAKRTAPTCGRRTLVGSRQSPACDDDAMISSARYKLGLEQLSAFMPPCAWRWKPCDFSRVPHRDELIDFTRLDCWEQQCARPVAQQLR